MSPAISVGDDSQIGSGIHGSVVGLVPSEAVVARRVSLPAAGGRRSEQLVRYTLEDSLAEDIESLHFSVAARSEGNDVLVLAARESDLGDWLQWFASRGVTLSGLLPDYFSLPAPTKGFTVAVKEGRVLVREAWGTGFAAPLDLLPRLLGPAPETATEGTLWVVSGSLDSSAQPLRERGWRIDGESCTREEVTLPMPGLLTGAHRPRSAGKRRRWFLAGILAAASLVLEVGGSAYHVLQLDGRTDELDRASLNLFRETFPATERVVDVEAQAEQGLSELQRLHQQKAHGFLAMLDTLLATSPPDGRLRFAALRYAGDEMTATLAEAVSPEKLQPMLPALQARGLAVKMVGQDLVLRWK
jgi:general secretion pathway protein L